MVYYFKIVKTIVFILIYCLFTDVQGAVFYSREGISQEIGKRTGPCFLKRTGGRSRLSRFSSWIKKPVRKLKLEKDDEFNKQEQLRNLLISIDQIKNDFEKKGVDACEKSKGTFKELWDTFKTKGASDSSCQELMNEILEQNSNGELCISETKTIPEIKAELKKSKSLDPTMARQGHWDIDDPSNSASCSVPGNLPLDTSTISQLDELKWNFGYLEDEEIEETKNWGEFFYEIYCMVGMDGTGLKEKNWTPDEIEKQLRLMAEAGMLNKLMSDEKDRKDPYRLMLALRLRFLFDKSKLSYRPIDPPLETDEDTVVQIIESKLGNEAKKDAFKMLTAHNKLKKNLQSGQSSSDGNSMTSSINLPVPPPPPPPPPISGLSAKSEVDNRPQEIKELESQTEELAEKANFPKFKSDMDGINRELDSIRKEVNLLNTQLPSKYTDEKIDELEERYGELIEKAKGLKIVFQNNAKEYADKKSEYKQKEDEWKAGQQTVTLQNDGVDNTGTFGGAPPPPPPPPSMGNAPPAPPPPSGVSSINKQAVRSVRSSSNSSTGQSGQVDQTASRPTLSLEEIRDKTAKQRYSANYQYIQDESKRIEKEYSNIGQNLAVSLKRAQKRKKEEEIQRLSESSKLLEQYGEQLNLLVKKKMELVKPRKDMEKEEVANANIAFNELEDSYSKLKSSILKIGIEIGPMQISDSNRDELIIRSREEKVLYNEFLNQLDSDQIYRIISEDGGDKEITKILPELRRPGMRPKDVMQNSRAMKAIKDAPFYFGPVNNQERPDKLREFLRGPLRDAFEDYKAKPQNVKRVEQMESQIEKNILQSKRAKRTYHLKGRIEQQVDFVGNLVDEAKTAIDDGDLKELYTRKGKSSPTGTVSDRSTDGVNRGDLLLEIQKGRALKKVDATKDGQGSVEKLDVEPDLMQQLKRGVQLRDAKQPNPHMKPKTKESKNMHQQLMDEIRRKGK